MNYAMMSKTKKVLYTIVAILLFVVTVGSIWYVNHIIPFMMDDEWYATLLYSDAKIKNLLDIFEAQKWHYMNWGGRSVAHTLLQIVLLSGEIVADIVNTMLVLLTAVIVVAISQTMTRLKRSFSEWIMAVDIVMGLILGLNANWKMSLFWQSGAANYLYITIFILLFIWVYMREIPYDCFGSKEPLFGVSLWIIPLALIAGWSNENMGPVVFFFSVATIIYVKKVGHIVEPWMVLGSLFSFIGSALCIAAPGNFVRAGEVISNDYGILWKSYLHGYYETTAIFEYLMLAVIVTLVMIALCKGVANNKLGIEIIFVLIMAVLSWAAMALSPHYPDRATYGTLILLILAIMAMSLKILERKPLLAKYLSMGGLLIWLRGMYKLYEYMGISWGWIL